MYTCTLHAQLFRYCLCSLPFGEYESTEATVGTLRASGVCSLPLANTHRRTEAASSEGAPSLFSFLSFSAWEGGTDRERRSGGDVRERKKTISVVLIRIPRVAVDYRPVGLPVSVNYQNSSVSIFGMRVVFNNT